MSFPLPEPPPAIASASFGCTPQHSGRDAVWLELSGELDLASAGQFAEQLRAALDRARLVVLDLRPLTFMDSTGLAAIVCAHDRARASARQLALIRGPRQVERLLELTGFAGRLIVIDLPRD